ncbi:Ig-like domain-containing protein [Prosthecobacter vanneervenii]|uniref:Outer membrane protein assembly factor BamB n=1 Tax=Prosthecobacter vanneervenii TaxID=48466 RepID=A0A7W8DJV1_9BACT|nr:outer membrane protein assembly factor BamB [Prosthecobacter vanneervenii]
MAPRSGADLAASAERERFLRQARVLQQRDTAPDEKGNYTRKRVVEAKFKYPYLRVEESWKRDPTTGTDTMLDQKIMVADHFLMTLKDGVTAEELQAVLQSLGGKVRRHVPNSQVYLVEPGTSDLDLFDSKLADYRQKGKGMQVVEPDYVVFASMVPNDPSFSSLWGLNNNGQNGGVGDADIDAPEAWDVARGSAAVVVGIIDTGIDYTHPDLAANIWLNAGEVPDNGIDDDHNGYIDDTRGWDFVSNDNDPADDHYHGTHCAGTIGAVGNNGIGVAGVCHNVRMMALKFLSSGGGGSTSDAIEAVLYATANHVTLTSNSWGGGGYSQTLKDAIDAAGAAGILFVAAAGNSSLNTDVSPSYPASYDSANIISVAASDNTDSLASFTNFGATTVDLAAPGVSIYSTSPGGGYRTLSGTSMACPHVAGSCALMKSARPTMGWLDIKNSLIANVDGVAGMNGKMVANGRLNLARALVIATGPYVTLATLQASDSGQQGGTGNNDGILSPGEDITLAVTLKNSGSQTAFGITSTLSSTSAGNYVTVLQGSHSWGDLTAGGTAYTGSSPFLIRIAANAPTPLVFSLNLTTADTNGNTWDAQAQLTAFRSSTVAGSVTAVTGGAGIGGALISYTGTSTGSVIAAADGRYSVNLTDGTYQFRAAAPGYNASASTVVTVPPAPAAVNFALGKSHLQVNPTSLASTQYEDSVATKSLTLTNNGDLPLVFDINTVPRASVFSMDLGAASISPAPVTDQQDAAAESQPAGATALIRIESGSTTLPFSDSFESGSLSNWTMGSGAGTREIVSSTAAAGSKSFHYTYQGSTSHFNGISQDFASGAKPKSISFWVRSGSTATHDGYFVLTDGTYGAELIWFYASGLGTFYVNGDVGGDKTYTYQANIWYHVEFQNLDWTAKTFDYYVNGTLVKAGIPFRNPSLVDEVSQLWLYNFSTGSEAWWDDIRLMDSSLNWLTQSPAGGTLAPGQSATVTVTLDATSKLAADYLGQIDISSNDPANPVVSVPVTMTVQQRPNTPPVANAQTVTLNEDAQAVITLTGSDAEGDALTAQIQTLPAAGTLYQTSDGTSLGDPITAAPAIVSNNAKKVIFVPPPNANGIPYGSLQFLMKDKRSQSTAATVTLNVTPVNDIPVAFDDSASGLPGQVISPIKVLANDIDVDGQTLTLTSFTQGQKGTVASNGDGTLSFTPNASFTSGQDSFTYTISDGAGGTATARVTVAVGLLAAGPWPMMGANAAHTGFYPGSLNGQTLSQAWTLQVAPQALNQVSIAEGKVFASPDIYFNETQVSAVDLVTGTLAWKYTWPLQARSINGPAYYGGSIYVQRGKSTSGTDFPQTVSLDAGTGAQLWATSFGAQWEEYLPPTVTDTSVFVDGGTYGGMYGYNRTSGSQLFFNSSLEQYDTWTPSVYNGKVYSFVTGKFRQHNLTTGAIEWTLDLTWNWSGYTMARTMAIASGAAFVVNNRTPSNELVCIDLSTQAVRWRVQTGFAVSTPSISGSSVYAFDASGNVNAYDISTGTLQKTYITGIGSTGLYQPIITNDALIASSSTSTAVHTLSSGTKIQTIAAGGIPSLSNGYLLLAGTDGVLRCYAVISSGNRAPVASVLMATGVEDQLLTLTLPGTDADNNPIVGIITSLPAKGVMYQTPDGVQVGSPITLAPVVVQNSARKVIYRPAPDGFGTPYTTFKFKVNDGTISSAEVTSTINITNVNDPPVAVNDTVYLRAGSTLSSYQPTANDVDVDNEPLTIVSFTNPARGALTQNGDGSLNYVPQAGFTEGTDSFQYTLRDGAGAQSTATVQVLVSASYGREWTQFGNGPNHTGRYPGSLGTQTWVQRWEYAFPSSINPIAVAGGKVYATQTGNWNNYMYAVALDTVTGGEAWRTKFQPGNSLNPPSYYAGTVYTQRGNNYGDTQLWALKSSDGSVLWNTPHDSQWERYFSPAVSDLGVYVDGGSYGGIYGFNYQTGTQKFFLGLEQVDQWTPAIIDGKVYSFVSNTFRNHHPDTGVVQWSVNLTGSSSGSMNRTICGESGRAYVVNQGASGTELVCVDLQTQSVLWRTAGNYNGTPAIANGIVYACCGGVVKACNASTGVWTGDYTAGTETSLNGSPVVSNDLLIIGSSSKTYIFNLINRSLIQTLAFGSQAAVVNDLLYLSCSDNKVRLFGHTVASNHTPVALAAQAGILEEAQAAITLEGTDADGEALSYVVRTLPVQGTLYQTVDGNTKGAAITQAPAQVLNDSGIVIYVAPLNVFGAGAGSFTFTASDQVSTSAAATISINIAPVNDPPVAVADSIALRPGESLLNFHPEANDRDVDGDVLKVVSYTQGASGQVTQSADGTLQYAPNAGFTSGTDTFTYTISDAANVQASAAVSVTISTTLGRSWPTFGAGPDHTGFLPVRLGSTAFTQVWQTNMTKPAYQLAVSGGKVFASLQVYFQDSSLVALDSASGGELWRSNFTQPAYMNPPTFFNNSVFMQYAYSSSSKLYCLNATTGATTWSSPFGAQWETYLAPAVDSSGVYVDGGTYGGMYAYNLSTGAQLFYQSLDQYDQWTPTLYNGGLYSYMKGIFRSHNKSTGAVLWSLDFGWNWAGYSMGRTTACAYNCAYLVNDSVTIPSGSQELICVDLNQKKAAWKVLGSFSGTPAVAHQAVFAISGGNSIRAYDSASGVFIGAYTLPGTDTGLVMQPIVTNDAVIASSAAKTYIFDLGTRALRQTILFGGNISLAGSSLYIASSDNYIRSFSVPDSANHPPAAISQTAATLEDTRVTLTLQGTDADNDALNFVITSLPAAGTLYQTSDGTTIGNPVSSPSTLVTNAQGKVIFLPAADRNGSPLTSFNFAASDGKSLSAPATATLNVQPVNDAPVARADVRVAQPGQILSPVRERLNDYDVDGDALTVLSFTQPALGTVARNSDGTLRYQAPSDITTGSTQFSYTITDPSGAAATASVTVSIMQSITGTWPSFGNGPAHTGYSTSALGRTGWAMRWSNAVGSGGYNSLQPIASAEGRIYASFRDSSSCRVIALNAGSGAQLWSRSFTSAFSMNPPSYYNGRVYVQRCNNYGDTQLYALQSDTGATVWSAPLAAQWENYMAPAVSDLGIFADGGAYGGMYGLSASGTQMFFQTKPQSDSWTPSILDSELYAFVNGDFARHNPASGAVLWTRSLGWGGFGYSMGRTTALDNRRAYLVNDSPTAVYYDEDLVCINLDTQAVVWSVNSDFTGTPAVSSGTVFVISGNTVQARNTTDGGLVCTYSTPAGTYLSGQPVVTDDLVIAASGSNTFIFGRYDQVLLATLSSGGSPAVVDDALIISNPSAGTVSAWAAQPAITFSPPGGSFDQPVNVVIGAADATTQIHYTVDGSAPDFTSPQFVSGTPVRMGWSGKIRAISVKGSDVSRIYEATFSIADTDLDGIADWWEMQNFGSLSLASATTDSDHDGMSDLNEFRAGTDPRSALDRLEIVPSKSQTAPDNELLLTWNSKAGRLYIVETSSDLSTWTPATTVLTGTGTNMSFTMNKLVGSRQFGRVRVLPGLMSQ